MSDQALVKWDSKDLEAGVAAYKSKLADVLFKLGQYWSPQIETYAKSHHKWTDRTGGATGGLKAVAVREGSNTVINLFHTVEYGLWLEVRWAGRYAVIMPTLNAFGSPIMDSIRKLFS